jgi:glycosyltransferase involved in cell wall biosynthesis
VVTNLGSLSEPVWAGVPGVALAPAPDPDALASLAEAILALTPADRDALGGRAAEYYRGRFSLEHTVARLRTDPPAHR